MDQANVEPTTPEQALPIPGGTEPVVQPTLGNPEGAEETTTTDGGVVPPSPEIQPEVKKPKEDHYARRLNRFMNKAAELEAQNLALQAQILGAGKQPGNAQAEPQKPARENFLVTMITFRHRWTFRFRRNCLRFNSVCNRQLSRMLC